MKQRIIRMFDGKKRKHGVDVTVTVLLITILVSISVGCAAKPITEPDSSSQTAGSEQKNNSSNSDSTPGGTQINQTAADKPSNSTESTTDTLDEKAIVSETKEYIIHGQNDKPEAGKLKWSSTFLDQVNIEAVYQQYISASGKADDIESFAKYLTENAPVSVNWKEMFEADLLKAYGEKVSKYELLQDNLYQVYVKKDGTDIPYVVVNARTGNFHG
ncbi:hypothetical protein J9303_03190 [Bacillaceae bacterium Marseille-Q3522]|nr:hypothetical protein [Bacillaceae bacterium Marseille-Q3522]